MATRTQANVIQVPALMDEEKAIVPQFWLERDIEYRRDRKNYVLSAAEYNSQMTLPTLAELVHAFFSGSKDYKQSVLAKPGCGEWTSTFLQGSKKAVENPENVVYRNGVWVLEGGTEHKVELPPSGWILEYDKPTGFPSRSSQKRKDAENVFGDNTSFFYVNRSDTRAVSRCFYLFGDSGPFYVNADCGPGDRYSDIGGRACRRSEQSNYNEAPKAF